MQGKDGIVFIPHPNSRQVHTLCKCISILGDTVLISLSILYTVAVIWSTEKISLLFDF